MTGMMVKPIADSMLHLARELLSDPEIGLQNIVTDDEEREMVERTISLLNALEQGETVAREEWTDLKRLSLKRVASPVANVVNRIASIARTPEVGESAVSYAAEELIEAWAAYQRQKVAQSVQAIVNRCLA